MMLANKFNFPRGITALTVLALVGSPARAATPALLASRAAAVLAQHCYTCHGNGKTRGGFGIAHDLAALRASEYIDLAHPERSPLVDLPRRGAMPPTGPHLSPAEVQTLEDWIRGGAPLPTAAAPEVTATGDFFEVARKADDEAAALILADQQTLPEERRARTRYLSLARIGLNPRIPALSRTLAREGLLKAINSLTRRPLLILPPTLGKTGAGAWVYRITLDKMQWSAGLWSRIAQAVTNKKFQWERPAAPARQVTVPAELFVAQAFRAPQYDEFVIQEFLPEAFLGDDDDKPGLANLLNQLNLDPTPSLRAGLRVSGVEYTNRILERHPLDQGAGVYWLTYNFESNDGLADIFAHPLGPTFAFAARGGGREAESVPFQHADSEVLWTLPNGMIAFGQFEATGGFKNELGPDYLASLGRKSAAENVRALSCLACHASGIRPAKDDLREAIDRDATFSVELRAAVAEVYRGNAEVQSAMAQDTARYRAVLNALGLTQSLRLGVEPITFLYRLYQENYLGRPAYL
jgi:mono/diheme cytochrome c family protein